MRRTLVLSLLALSLLAPRAAAAEKRVALVIGNADYKSVRALANPANDAEDMAAKLGALGFSVTKLVNADLNAMEKARRDFAADAQGAQLRFFYYAGHGVQAEGTNWLLPVDVDVKEDYELKTKAFSAQSLLDGLEAAGPGVNVVVLDACRDNPFKASSRSAGASRGLAVMGIHGSYIVYATAAGSTAADGSGRNGLFTECLLSRLDSPGLSLQEIMTNVAADVVAKSAGKQEPWKQDNLTKMVYFVTPEEARASFGARIAEGDAALQAAEAELASLRESAGKEADAAKKQALELEIKKKAALEAQKRQENDALKAEKDRQAAAVQAQAQEAAQLASFKSEQASREEAIRKAAEAKRREIENLKSGSGTLAYIFAIEAARKAQDELDRQYDDSQAKIKASVSGTFDQKLSALASWTIDPWENEAEFKARTSKESSRLSSEKKAALADALADTEAQRKAALAPFEDSERTACASLEAARTVYKGSSVKLEIGAFDRDAKVFPITLTLSDPKLSYKASFSYSVKSESSDELKRHYLEFDSWMKAGALFGEVEASVIPAGDACFVNQLEAVRLRAVDSSGEKVLYEDKTPRLLSVFSSSADQGKPRGFSSYLYAIAPGAAISVNGSVAGMGRAFLADPKPGAYAIRASLPDGTSFEEKRSITSSSAEKVTFAMNGSIVADARTAGMLWLDGKQVGWLPEGETRELGDLAPTSHAVEMRYANGKSEQLQQTVKPRKRVSVSFLYEFQVVCVGWIGNSSASAADGAKATVWRGGSPTALSAKGAAGKAYAAVKSGADLYIAGYWSEQAGGKSAFRACYWKNGSRVDLPASAGESKAVGIALSGGTVYACGYYMGDKGQKVACYWAGGKRFDLSSSGADAGAEAIAVSGSVVYTAGWYKGQAKNLSTRATRLGQEKANVPCYWIGTKKVDLSSSASDNSYASCLAVGDGKLYIGGYYWDGSRTYPCLWEGSSRALLPTSGNRGGVNGIVVSDGIVLMAGQYHNGSKWVPCYWLGTSKRVDLPSNVDAEASTVSMIGGLVYVGGYEFDKNLYTPCYWKDGKLAELYGVSADSDVASIFVQE